MNCVVYKSLRKTDTYLFVEREDDFSRVPAALIEALGRLEFVMRLELSPERKLAQADAHQVRQQIGDRGFYLQLPPAEPDPRTAH